MILYKRIPFATLYGVGIGGKFLAIIAWNETYAGDWRWGVHRLPNRLTFGFKVFDYY